MNKSGDNAILDKSFLFAIRIIKLYQYLCKEHNEFVLSKQILRSGTSIGANAEEAHGGISDADFSNKVSTSYKEARETKYWLRLLHAAGYIEQKLFDSLFLGCDELCKLSYAIIDTTRINKRNKNSRNEN